MRAGGQPMSARTLVHVLPMVMLLLQAAAVHGAREVVSTKCDATGPPSGASPEAVGLSAPCPFDAYTGRVPTGPNGQVRQDAVAHRLLANKTGGFFVEMGANDGVFLSNTLWLERQQSWSGLLIEAQPSQCAKLYKLHRHAHVLCACLSATTDSAVFVGDADFGGIAEHMDAKHASTHAGARSSKKVTVPCVQPELAFGAALGSVANVDYFSLDVEGAEAPVLRSLGPLLQSGRLIVHVWSIEYRVWDGRRIHPDRGQRNLEALRTFFNETGGYCEWGFLTNERGRTATDENYGLDALFVRRPRVRPGQLRHCDVHREQSVTNWSAIFEHAVNRPILARPTRD